MNKLLILSTGGTIDKLYFDALSQYQVGAPVAQSILESMNVAFELETIEVCRKDSLEIDIDDRNKLKMLIDESATKAILVTHGTDTMVQTALSLVDYLGGYDNKIIVFTGAMQPAVFSETDADFNIGTALGALNCAQPGVYIAMSGRVFLPGNVTKNYQKKRFEAAND